MDKKETRTDYAEGICWLREHGFRIHGVVCDGLKGLPQMLASYKVQLCQFHQVKTVKTKLTSRPKTAAGRELREISLMLCHTDKESFAGALDEWYSRWGEYLKERSIEAKTGRRIYTHKNLRSAYFSLKRNMKWLWTFYDFPECGIPNTNNGIEALFTDLKTKLRVHCGLSKRNRRVFIDKFFKRSFES